VNRYRSVASAAILVLMAAAILTPRAAQAQVPRNVVLEFCTGTWCQWCPCGDQTAEALLATYPSLVVLAYHGAGTDPWRNFNGFAVRDSLGFYAYPTGIIDRRNHPGNGGSYAYVTYNQWANLVAQRFANAPTTNVKLEVVAQSYNSSTRQLNLSISATALQNLSGWYRMSLILTEDGLIYPQTGNATCGYPPADYVHNWVVRSMVNGPLGQNLNSGPWVQDQMLTKTFTTTLDAAWNAEHLRYTAIVHKDSANAQCFGEIAQALQGEMSIGLIDVPRQPDAVPPEFALRSCPNPFKPATAIQYQLPVRCHVTLRVVDVLGREVATLVNGMEEAGYKSVVFDGSRLASGVYFYRLEAGKYAETRKLMLLK
jgi:hypothetical protein